MAEELSIADFQKRYGTAPTAQTQAPAGPTEISIEEFNQRYPDQAQPSHIRTPQETESVLRRRYPQAYQDQPSVGRQVATGAAKQFVTGGMLGGAVSGVANLAGSIQRLRGKPEPMEPQGPGEEAGAGFMQAAEMAPSLLPAVRGVKGAIQGWRQGRAVDKAVEAERVRRLAKEALDGPPVPRRQPAGPKQPPVSTTKGVPPWRTSTQRTPDPAPPPAGPPPPGPSTQRVPDPAPMPPEPEIPLRPSTQRAPGPVPEAPIVPEPEIPLRPSTQRAPGPVPVQAEPVIPLRPSTQRPGPPPPPAPTQTPIYKGSTQRTPMAANLETPPVPAPAPVTVPAPAPPVGEVPSAGAPSVNPAEAKPIIPKGEKPPVPSTGKKKPSKKTIKEAQEAVAEATMGTKKGGTIPFADTSAEGAATRTVNSWNKHVAGKSHMGGEKVYPKITMDQFKKMSKTLQQEVSDTIEELREPPKLAAGGVVAPQKSRVRRSNRGVIYGPPGELRRMGVRR